MTRRSRRRPSSRARAGAGQARGVGGRGEAGPRYVRALRRAGDRGPRGHAPRGAQAPHEVQVDLSGGGGVAVATAKVLRDMPDVESLTRLEAAKEALFNLR